MTKLYYTIILCAISVLFSGKSYAYFIENRGQITDQNGIVNDDVLFMHKQPGLKVILTNSGFSYEKYNYELSDDEIESMVKDEYLNPTFNIESYRVDFKFNHHPSAIITGQPLLERLNYYGSKANIQGVAQFEKITYFNVQEGIDIEFLVNSEGRFKYNIIARDSKSARDFSIAIYGSENIYLANNSLCIETPLGILKEEIPTSYLNRKGKLNEVAVLFQLNTNHLSFITPSFSEEEYLIIDPQPEGVWGTYYGGSEYDITTEIHCDLNGYVYQTGITMSNNIATSGAHEVTYQGGLDGFLTKHDTEGNLIWSTYYGGDQTDRPYAITSDSLGYVYLGGASYSTVGIATVGNYQLIVEGMDDIFVAKFDSDGLRQWGTYIGGSGHDFVTSMKHRNNRIYLTGHSTSGTGMTTPGTFLPSYTAVETGYLVCLDDIGVNLLWGTYIGADMNSSGEDLEVIDDFIYVAGRTGANIGISSAGSHQPAKAGFGNGFLQKFNTDGTLVWGTYYGGQFTDKVYGTALDYEGNIYIAGEASSTTNISTPGAYQETRLSSEHGFLAKFNPDGVRQWGTYLGGTSSDYITSLAATDSILVVVGKTLSTSNISSTGAYQETLAGDFDGFLNGFNLSGAYQWGSYFGGEYTENIAAIDVGLNGNLYLAGDVSGSTAGIAFGNASQPLFGGASSDGFSAKFCLASPVNITYSDGFLIATGADEYEWFLNGLPTGIYNDSISPSEDGDYSVQASSDGNCVIASDDFTYSTVSISENEKDVWATIYPNPIINNQWLTIEAKSRILSIRVYDLQGKEILVKNTPNIANESSLRIGSLNAGVYMVKVKMENGYFETKLVVY